jgi:uncharacterized protein YjiS (DUF1127 family)
MRPSTHLNEMDPLEEVAIREVTNTWNKAVSHLDHACNESACEVRDASKTLGDMVLAAVRAVVTAAQKLSRRLQQWRRSRALYNDLRHFDDRMLRDVGLDRHQMPWAAAEAIEKRRLLEHALH